MKRLLLALAFIPLFIAAQVNWTTNRMNVSGSINARLGTTNKRSLNFGVVDTTRIRIDSLGRFQVRNLAGAGTRLVYADADGRLFTRGGGGSMPDEDLCNRDFDNNSWAITADGNGGLNNLGFDQPCPSRPCQEHAGPWYEGGNRIGLSGGDNRIGTCNAYDFILMAGGNNRIWINNSNGRVGIAESTPAARLHIKETTALGTSLNSSQLLMRTSANANTNDFMHNIWLRRYTTSSTNWQGAALHDGISVDNSFLTPGSNTRTWWERRPDEGTQLWGNSSATFMTLSPQNGGQLLIGTKSSVAHGATAKLQVEGKIVCQELYVTKPSTDWPDFVFEESYRLPTLQEVEDFYIREKHLIGIPSKRQIAETGVNVSDMVALLLQKVEELTIYTVELKKELEKAKAK